VKWWELVAIALPGLLALAGVIYGKYQDRKQKREEADQTNQARREPTWNELVTENRNLRTEVATLNEKSRTQGEDIERIKSDVASYKSSTNRKFNAFENMLRDLFHQWPKDAEYPVFNSDDLSELRDADIPWRDRVRAVP
jgi:uncharacterized protein HemX